MLYVQSLHRRSWVSIGWLIVIALGTLVAVFNMYVGVLLIMLASLGGAMLVLPRISLAQQPSVTQEPASGAATWPSTVQRTVYTTAGTTHSAFVVPVQGIEGYQTVLTRDGYRLVNDAGQIVYTFKD
jgi:hypothetical protein